MMPTPKPGYRPGDVVAVLNDQISGLMRVQSMIGTTFERLTGYLEWTSEASRRLRDVIDGDAAERLTLRGRYRDLLAMIEFAAKGISDETRERIWASIGKPARDTREMRVVNVTLSGQITDQLAALENARDTLTAEQNHYADVGDLLVPDTNVLMEHAGELTTLDWARWLSGRSWGVHVVVPMQVMDELENLKDRGQDDQRTQARVALRTLIGVLRTQPADSIFAPMRHGEWRTSETDSVTVELLRDPRARVRLPRADDEIIDRAVAVQAVSGRPVTVVTYDTPMSARAELEGLRYTLLDMSEPQKSRRAERREKREARENHTPIRADGTSVTS
jgi:hypothetical protein